MEQQLKAYQKAESYARIYGEIKAIDKQLDTLQAYARNLLDAKSSSVDVMMEILPEDRREWPEYRYLLPQAPNMFAFVPVDVIMNDEELDSNTVGHARYYKNVPSSEYSGIQLVIPNTVAIAAVDRMIHRLTRIRSTLISKIK